MAKQNLDELIEESEVAIAKGEDLSDIDAEHHHKEKPKVESRKSKVEEKIKAQSPEALAKGEPKIKPKKSKTKVRSKKYQKSYALIDTKKKYDINDAIELTRKTSFSKFIGNIEVHIHLVGKSGKAENIRGLLNYPHNTGKKIDIIILDDKTIEEIIKSSKAPADIYLATPNLMPKVARLAKILGPKGKMPNPKAGTITTDPKKTKSEMEAGQTEYKTDTYGIIHQIIGKTSASNEDLIDNYKELISVLPKDKISTINFCATMGPAIKVQK